MESRANANNLPLALELIRHLSYACRPSVKLMLALCKRLRQWVCNVIVCWYSANLHISSIDDLSNEMEASEYVFGSLVRSRLLSLCNGSIVITIEIHWVHNARDNSKFGNELFDPNGLLRRIGCSNILSLCRRIGNCVLL